VTLYSKDVITYLHLIGLYSATIKQPTRFATKSRLFPHFVASSCGFNNLGHRLPVAICLSLLLCDMFTGIIDRWQECRVVGVYAKVVKSEAQFKCRTAMICSCRMWWLLVWLEYRGAFGYCRWRCCVSVEVGMCQ